MYFSDMSLVKGGQPKRSKTVLAMPFKAWQLRSAGFWC